MCKSDNTRTLLAILTWTVLSVFLVSCSTVGGNSVLPRKSFAEQVNESFIADLPLPSRINLSSAEYRAFDYAAADEEVEWRDENGLIHGVLVASQIFKVGVLSCRRFTHTRLDSYPPTPPLKGTVCRHDGEDWQLVR